MSTTDALESALLQGTNLDNVTSKAEDLQQSGGIDWSKHFFEPKPGCDYTIKFVTNIEGSPIVHRSVYKNLPDPDRKGKSFRYVSDRNAKTCPVMRLFFDLHKLKTEGDIEAGLKIEKYLKSSNQGACIVQILASPDPAEVNQFRIMMFPTFGENATIANMINKKIKPSEQMIKNGIHPVDIFNVFGSPALLLSCREVSIGDGKGRGYSGSEWLDSKKYGCIVEVDGKTHEFSEADKTEDGKLKDEIKPFFQKLIENLKNPDISIHNYFEHVDMENPGNATKETLEYLQGIHKKMDEIIPVIREHDCAYIASYGRNEAAASTSKDKAQTIGGQSASDILKESAPTELQGSTLNQPAAAPAPAPAPAPHQTAQAAPAPAETAAPQSSELADILNS